MRIIHISDTHFTDFSSSIDRIETIMSSLTNYIPNLWGGGEYTKTVVITGDITDSGDDEDYNTARYFITRLQKSGFVVYAIPGNHDYCKVGWLKNVGPFGSRRQKFVDCVYSITHQPNHYPQVVDLVSCKLILLDSMQAEMDEDTGDEFAQGKLGEQQLSDLKALLAGYEKDRKNGTKIAVALHHHPFKPIKDYSLDGLVDADEFLGIIAYKVDCLLIGHSTPEEFICQKSFSDPETTIFGIPIINVENLEHMNYSNGKIAVIDLDCNCITVYPTDITQIPEKIYGKTPTNTQIHIRPIVNRSDAVIYNYSDAAPSIKFQSGDRVTMTIGGGVQTGGKEKTWKRYVNPSGGSSDHLFYGQIYIPGITSGLTPIRDLVPIYGSYDSNSPDKCTLRFTIPKIDAIPESNRYLALGYVDKAYGDNGYWGHDHDDGTEDQCKNVGSAYVKINIQYIPKILSVRQYMKQVGADPSAGIRHLLSGGAISVRDLLSY